MMTSALHFVKPAIEQVYLPVLLAHGMPLSSVLFEEVAQDYNSTMHTQATWDAIAIGAHCRA